MGTKGVSVVLSRPLPKEISEISSLSSPCLPPCETKVRKHSSDGILVILDVSSSKPIRKYISVVYELHRLRYSAIVGQMDEDHE